MATYLGHIFNIVLIAEIHLTQLTYVSEAWREDSQGYYGTGESFLFKLTPEFGVYRWSRKNDFFMCSNPNWLAVGASDCGFGLHLDAYPSSVHRLQVRPRRDLQSMQVIVIISFIVH